MKKNQNGLEIFFVVEEANSQKSDRKIQTVDS